MKYTILCIYWVLTILLSGLFSTPLIDYMGNSDSRIFISLNKIVKLSNGNFAITGSYKAEDGFGGGCERSSGYGTLVVVMNSELKTLFVGKYNLIPESLDVGIDIEEINSDSLRITSIIYQRGTYSTFDIDITE